MSKADTIIKNAPYAGTRYTGILSMIEKRKMDILLITLIVIFAFIVRYINIMGMGITWDEPFYVQAGITYLDNLMHVNFQASAWSLNMEHPPVSKYLYGAMVWIFNGGSYDINAFFISKVLSAVMGAVTCALVYIICREFINKYVGVISSVILALIPDFVAHTQIAAIDAPVALFFTLTMYLFMMAMKTKGLHYYVASAISLGLLIGTKFNGVLILPIMLILYLINSRKNGSIVGKPDRQGILSRMDAYVPIIPSFIFFAIAAVTFYILWPWIWTDPINLLRSLKHWVFTPQEYFLGTLQPAPLYYYPVYFLVTTPVLLLIPLAIGAYRSIRSRDVFLYAILLWFIVPFSYNFFDFVQDTMRYLLMIYPAVAIICGYGIWVIVSRLSGSKESLKIFLFTTIGALTIVYLILSLTSVSPYYLDYYNEISGGTKNVADHRLFEIGWWGEGIYDSIRYVDQNTHNATVLVAAKPNFYIDLYGTNNTYICPNNEDIYAADNVDYIVTNAYIEKYGSVHFNVSSYKIVQQTMIQGVPLATVFQKVGPG